jgi:hypothetical protein
VAVVPWFSNVTGCKGAEISKLFFLIFIVEISGTFIGGGPQEYYLVLEHVHHSIINDDDVKRKGL